MKKWLIPLIYIAIMAAAFAYREQISLLLDHPPSPLMMLVLAALLALFPVIPYKLVIAAIGMLYGPWAGALITVTGSTLSGIILYAAGAVWYRNDAASLVERYPAMRRFTSYVARHPFESVLLYRLLPVVPQWVINLYAGIAAIPFRLYLSASVIGKLPGIFVYAFLGSSLFSHPLLAAEILGFYLLFVAAAVWGYKRRSARRTG
ncbi:TVP38/TMEM64 family protein [Paenibacillus pinistramenti]|uniref:TVP38/TMEM64 family protein n=1 Tax=Paenibacillus pinistramenti TaxID=1768003 RepID=UPI0013969F24|nr:VTT domain-containing protein [Paenibacillus pinistramenti]